MRPKACMVLEASNAIEFLIIWAVRGVSVMPGATTLKRKLRLAYVAAADCARPIMPAFAAAIAS